MRQSPHGRRPGWAATPIIVKSGDDCRQELLAAQLIEAFHDIFMVRQYAQALERRALCIDKQLKVLY